MRAILLIDHGSRRAEANETVASVAALVAALGAEGAPIVRFAHMELASPSIAEGVEACVAAGATELIAVPYMLGPGRHSREHIPAMVREALGADSAVRLVVAEPLGVDARLAELVLARAQQADDARR